MVSQAERLQQQQQALRGVGGVSSDIQVQQEALTRGISPQRIEAERQQRAFASQVQESAEVKEIEGIISNQQQLLNKARRDRQSALDRRDELRRQAQGLKGGEREVLTEQANILNSQAAALAAIVQQVNSNVQNLRAVRQTTINASISGREDVSKQLVEQARKGQISPGDISRFVGSRVSGKISQIQGAKRISKLSDEILATFGTKEGSKILKQATSGNIALGRTERGTLVVIPPEILTPKPSQAQIPSIPEGAVGSAIGGGFLFGAEGTLPQTPVNFSSTTTEIALQQSLVPEVRDLPQTPAVFEVTPTPDFGDQVVDFASSTIGQPGVVRPFGFFEEREKEPTPKSITKAEQAPRFISEPISLAGRFISGFQEDVLPIFTPFTTTVEERGGVQIAPAPVVVFEPFPSEFGGERVTPLGRSPTIEDLKKRGFSFRAKEKEEQQKDIVIQFELTNRAENIAKQFQNRAQRQVDFKIDELQTLVLQEKVSTNEAEKQLKDFADKINKELTKEFDRTIQPLVNDANARLRVGVNRLNRLAKKEIERNLLIPVVADVLVFYALTQIPVFGLGVAGLGAVSLTKSVATGELARSAKEAPLLTGVALGTAVLAGGGIGLVRGVRAAGLNRTIQQQIIRANARARKFKNARVNISVSTSKAKFVKIDPETGEKIFEFNANVVTRIFDRKTGKLLDSQTTSVSGLQSIANTAKSAQMRLRENIAITISDSSLRNFQKPARVTQKGRISQVEGTVNLREEGGLLKGELAGDVFEIGQARVRVPKTRTPKTPLIQLQKTRTPTKADVQANIIAKKLAGKTKDGVTESLFLTKSLAGTVKEVGRVKGFDILRGDSSKGLLFRLERQKPVRRKVATQREGKPFKIKEEFGFDIGLAKSIERKEPKIKITKTDSNLPGSKQRVKQTQITDQEAAELTAKLTGEVIAKAAAKARKAELSQVPRAIELKTPTIVGGEGSLGAFTGLGLFERTEPGEAFGGLLLDRGLEKQGKFKDDIGAKIKIKDATKFDPKIRTTDMLDLGLKDNLLLKDFIGIDGRLRVAQPVKISIRERQAQAQTLRLRQQLRLDTQTKQVTALLSSPSFTFPSLPTPKFEFKPKITVPKIPISKRLEIKVKKPRGIPHDVFIKKNKIADNLPKGQAKDFGAFVTDNTIAAQFRIKKSKGKIKSPPFTPPPNYFEMNRHKFRTFQKRAGRTIPLKNKWIEEDRLRLDTGGEVSNITAARLIKQRKGNAQQFKDINKQLNKIIGF